MNADAVKCYNQGNDLFEQEKFQEAIEAYDEAVKIKPEYASAWCNKGVALDALGRYEEAIEAYETAIRTFDASPSKETDPKYVLLSFNLGNTLYELKRYEEAIDAYKKAEGNKKHGASALCNKGLALYKLKKYKKAIEAYDEAIKTDDKPAAAFLNKGLALYKLKKYKKAIEAYKKAVEPKKGEYASAWCNMGIALYELKKYQEAIDACDRAIKIDEDNASIDSVFGEIYLGLGDLKSASQKAESALGKERCASALMLQGRIEIENKGYGNAIKLFEEAIVLNPGDPRPLLWKVYARCLKCELSFNTEQKNGKCFEEIDAIIRELERLNYRLAKKQEEKPYVLYLLGCLYYKRKDAFTAKEKLYECLHKCKLGSWPQIKRPARHLLDFIWNYEIKPTWWQWWLISHSYRWSKRMFCLLCLSILALLLLHPFIPMWGVPPYEENHALYGGLILLLLVLLVSPSIERIKMKGIEVELRSSPPDRLGFSSVGLTLSPQKMQPKLS